MFTNIICLRKFSFSPFRLFFHCADVLSTRVPSSEVMHPWSSLLLSLPSRWDGWSRDALVLLPEAFPLLPLDFGPAGGVEEPLVARSLHGSSLLSPRFIPGDSGVALLRRTPATCSVPVGSPSSTLHAQRGIGEGGSSRGFLCSRLPLPPHLCTLGEVVGRVSLPSTAPVRVLPGLPIFGLGSREGV